MTVLIEIMSSQSQLDGNRFKRVYISIVAQGPQINYIVALELECNWSDTNHASAHNLTRFYIPLLHYMHLPGFISGFKYM